MASRTRLAKAGGRWYVMVRFFPDVPERTPGRHDENGSGGADQRMIDRELLEILVCPETKQPVRLADSGLVHRINAAIANGDVTNRGGEAVKEAISGGLIREDGKLLYPIRDEIPIMLIDEAILLSDL